MNKIIFVFVIFIVLTAITTAQVPERISFQMVVRNNSDALVKNTQIGVRISILQGSLNGTAVYVEAHSPTTNAHGFVSLEIGGGELIDGEFDLINWNNGPFYVKIETDPDGELEGFAYTISATNQLYSVPYALYAKGAGGKLDKTCHYVGEFYKGGIVFWVDHTGKHGLIVSLIDVFPGVIGWSNIVNIAVDNTNFLDGLNNTIAIIEQIGHTFSAAKICDDYINEDYGTGVYSDWYLPSIAELNHLWNNLFVIEKSLTIDNNPLTETFQINYWSSTEFTTFMTGENAGGHTGGHAYLFSFEKGMPIGAAKFAQANVRAIRAF